MSEVRDDSDRLKNCPFCKGAAEFDQAPCGGYFVECQRCGASTGLRYACGDDPKPLLMEQWNTRVREQQATASVTEEMVEAAYGRYLSPTADRARRDALRNVLKLVAGEPTL
jgi:hypothetical protein